jgi:hypothetical protein
VKYCPNVDHTRSCKTYHQWAEQEWRVAASSCPNDTGYQADYAFGFQRGFVDYVELGGIGEPPPVPPRQYWKIASRSGAGKERAAQWFEGYRHGARSAMDGGYREFATLQSSLVVNMFDGPLAAQAMGQEIDPMNAVGSPQFEELPLPNDAESPFKDDFPSTQPSDDSKTDPVLEGEDPSPSSPTHGVNNFKAPWASRVISQNIGAAGNRDELTIEDVALHARTKVRHLPTVTTSTAKLRATPKSVTKSTPEIDLNGDAAAETLSSKSTMIRIVSAPTNAISDGNAIPSRVSE